MAKILVTGASGLLGSNLVHEAVQQHEVIAVSHTHHLRLEDAESVIADLSLPEAPAQIIGKHSPDWGMSSSLYPFCNPSNTASVEM